MPPTPAAMPGIADAPWRIVLQRGMREVEACLRPDGGLSQDSPGLWTPEGIRSGFDLDLSDVGVLPAGWYWLEGALQANAPTPSRPALLPVYPVHRPAGDDAIPLPEPGPGGVIGTMLLLAHDVGSLRFLPGAGAGRFSQSGFVLRRLSRWQALWQMFRCLGPGAAARFAAGAFGKGVSAAVVALYADYRQHVLPEALDAYTGWVDSYDTVTAGRLRELRAEAVELEAKGPLFSILVPTYQTPERWLRRCIESVLGQVYENWELCIADDASPDPKVREVIEEYVGREPRIRYVARQANGHISAASNSALAMARGEYVALLDHDDELPSHALLEMARAITSEPDVDLLYSDEDKIDAEGRRFDPYFKPDWNPDLLRSQNYVCHFTVIRRRLVEAVGGFREGFEGSQDHDLILRCIEQLAPARIVHVPRVLYHWRAIEGSTALAREEKDYAADAGERAVQDHLDRIGANATVEHLQYGHYRVRWPLPVPAPKVSLVIPTRDRVELLRTCVESLLALTHYPDFELVVVDNRSSEADALGYLDLLRQRAGVRVLRYDSDFNFSAINNWAVGQCDGDVVGLVNNDIEVISPDWLTEMVSHAMRADIGAVGAMLYYPNDLIQHAGVVMGVGGVANHAFMGEPRGHGGHGGRARVSQNYSAVTAACLLIRREVYLEVGGLDEGLAVAFNDIDFCLRLREQGYRNVWTPHAELYHHESASRGREDSPEKLARFASEVALMHSRWQVLLDADPAYNPNLTLEYASRSFGLAWPPRFAQAKHGGASLPAENPPAQQRQESQ